MSALLLLFACSETEATTESESSASDESPAPAYKDWDLGNGIIVSAPLEWAIGFLAPDPRCAPYFGEGTGHAPLDNTLTLSIPWVGTPFGSFDLATQIMEGTLENGETYKQAANGALYLDGASYFAYGQGSVDVTSLRENTAATIQLRDLVFKGADATEIRVTSSIDLDLHVSCAVPVGDPGESGDGDTDDSCVAVQDTPPYKNEECQRLTADFPDDVKY